MARSIDDQVAGRPSGPALVALVVGTNEAYAAGPGLGEPWPLADVASRVDRLVESVNPRWVVWSAGNALRAVVAAGVEVPRTWDLSEAHRLLHGGWWATPGHILAGCRGLPARDVLLPRRARRAGFDADLFDVAGPGSDDLLSDGGSCEPTPWRLGIDPDRVAALPTLLWSANAQDDSVRRTAGPAAERLVRTVWSESAAAVLCLELERDGLPVDRNAAEDLIGAAAGPRPRDDADATRIRALRDHVVLRHAPGRERTDLRNPAQVRDLLSSIGVDVPSTRAWLLEPYRHTHPLVDALLTWRKDERIATTYGYRWLDEHVGEDDRLRGTWTACDGAAGRMTAQNGLHNLPAALRPAICARPGHVFVRADLGQVEPRVLAVVSGDRAFAEATRSDDLYAPVATRLGVERPVAKVAVLAAMYGQRSGAAGEALEDLERAYPVAMGLLDRAYADGVAPPPAHLRRPPDSLRRGGSARWRSGHGAGCGGDEPSGIRPDGAADAAGDATPQRDHPGVGGRALQGVGGNGAPRGPPTRWADRAVPARRAPRPGARTPRRRDAPWSGPLPERHGRGRGQTAGALRCRHERHPTMERGQG